MIDVIYAERAALDYPLTRRVLERHPHARVIECDRYGALFNRAGQNFRLQKNRPALILAVKHGRLLMPAPAAYALGGRNNYYFSHLLNCLYDCRYCFLQGLYRSANYVLFVNYEDFADSIRRTARTHSGEPTWFFSGYDCDSLALEPITGFAGWFLPYFESLPDAWLELRTKSTQVRGLLSRPPVNNVVVAFSFTTENTAKALEHRVPGLARRIDAMAALQSRGWKVGLRFDPVVYHDGFEAAFGGLVEQIFSRIDAVALHSVCVGAFRLPRDFFKRMRRLYPREELFAAHLEERGGVVSYRSALERALLDSAWRQLAARVPSAILHRMEGEAA